MVTSMVHDSLLIGNAGGVQENNWSNQEFIQPPAGVDKQYTQPTPDVTGAIGL